MVSGYVKEKICQREDESSEEIATTLLHYLFPGEIGFPRPCPDVVSLLLDLGANPNDEPGCPSAWHKPLNYVPIYMDSIDLREASRRQDGLPEEDELCEKDDFLDRVKILTDTPSATFRFCSTS